MQMLAMSRLFVKVVAICAVCTGCGSGSGAAPSTTREQAVEADPSPAQGATPERGPLIVALGDSLTAGLGLDAEEAYPALLERQLRSEGFAFTVVNAGVSGDTSAAGLRRAEWALGGDVRVLIVAFGGNDGLRGLPANQMKQNLADVVSLARDRGIAVLLAGMEAPPNFGSTYTRQFREVYVELAREFDVAFMPFLLAGVAADPTLNQADGIHPNPEGARIVAAGVRAALEPLLPALAVEAP
jgi:acyl-CoA thioesterase-1